MLNLVYHSREPTSSSGASFCSPRRTLDHGCWQKIFRDRAPVSLFRAFELIVSPFDTIVQKFGKPHASVENGVLKLFHRHAIRPARVRALMIPNPEIENSQDPKAIFTSDRRNAIFRIQCRLSVRGHFAKYTERIRHRGPSVHPINRTSLD